MQSKRDYYTVLGVGHEATDEALKRAFRRLALEYHPDRNKEPDAEAKFKEINEAYQVLTDPEKRALYDRFGHAGVGGSDGTGRGFDGFETFGGLGDIFDAFFGGLGERTRGRPSRGDDLQGTVDLAFEDAAFGCEKELEALRFEACPRCHGNRREPETSAETCSGCRGSGQVRRSHQSLFGQFVQVVPCSTCRGEGRIIPHPCTQCRGSGRLRRRRRVMVTIPAGVDDGSQIRLTGEGDRDPHGGSPGDLYVRLRVAEHPLFVRQGDDLLYDLPVNVAQAALGETVEVPTLDGPYPLTIPAGIQSGAALALKGKGVPHLHSRRRGDIVVTVRVVIPRSLDPHQRALFEELEHSLGGSSAPPEKGWFDRLRETLGGTPS